MDSSASSLQDSKQGELREKIARTMPKVVCGECPYRKTLGNCNDGTICQWQKEYAEAIEKVVRQVLVPELPVLNNEEIVIAVCDSCTQEDRWSDEDCKVCQRNIKAAAQAQLDDVKRRIGG